MGDANAILVDDLLRWRSNRVLTIILDSFAFYNTPNFNKFEMVADQLTVAISEPLLRCTALACELFCAAPLDAIKRNCNDKRVLFIKDIPNPL